MVKTEDYVTSRLVVHDTIDKFNRDFPYLKAEWEYHETSDFGYFIIRLMDRGNVYECDRMVSVNVIVSTVPELVIQTCLANMKDKLEEKVREEQGIT